MERFTRPTAPLDRPMTSGVADCKMSEKQPISPKSAVIASNFKHWSTAVPNSKRLKCSLPAAIQKQSMNTEELHVECRARYFIVTWLDAWCACMCVWFSLSPLSLSLQEDLGSDPTTSGKVQSWAGVSHSTTQKFQLLVATRRPHAYSLQSNFRSNYDSGRWWVGPRARQSSGPR